MEQGPGVADERALHEAKPAPKQQKETEEGYETDEEERERRRKDASAAALTLEIVGDLPHAEIKPPENVLFVCKLNPVTRSEDLELIFSRFGTICSCEVIKDKKTGDSLQYAFIEFEDKASAEQAYVKMQNVLIDDRRIWVDFSQSVSKLHGVWVKQRARQQGRSSEYRNDASRSSHPRYDDRASHGSSHRRYRSRYDDASSSRSRHYDDHRSRSRHYEGHRSYEHDRERRYRDDRSLARYDDRDTRRDRSPDSHTDRWSYSRPSRRSSP